MRTKRKELHSSVSVLRELQQLSYRVGRGDIVFGSRRANMILGDQRSKGESVNDITQKNTVK